MPISDNTAGQEVSLFAVDTINNIAKTGDAANLSAQISIDAGLSAAATGTITEDDATDAPGMYELPLSQGETNGDLIIITPISSTSGIKLDPLFIYTEGAPLKNQANKIPVLAINKLTGEKVTGEAATITAQTDIDGAGTFASPATAAPTELDATNHPGVYLFTMTAGEMNGDRIQFTPVCSVDNIVLDPIVLYTRVAGGSTVIVIED